MSKVSKESWLMCGDCLKEMDKIPESSVDLILADLPYGTTELKWDTQIPLDCLWYHYWRVIKPDGAVVLFGSEPFSSMLRMHQIKYYKYDWIWKKNNVTGFPNAHNRPLKSYENLIVFSKGIAAPTKSDKAIMKYFPLGLTEINKQTKYLNTTRAGISRRSGRDNMTYNQKYTGYPKDILEFSKDTKCEHPTQKPVLLLEYLIKTYTQENDIVLDNVMGSGSTGVACRNTKRNFIGIEKDVKYFEMAEKRILGNS